MTSVSLVAAEEDATDPKTALYQSTTDDWETPRWLYDAYDRVYQFDLDVCATAETAKCDRWYGPDQDALMQPWEGRIWCNPPYGRQVEAWIARAIWAVQSVKTAPVAVLLLPSRTDTRWFHRHLYQAPGVQLDFLPGRVQFVGGESSAPFPSLVAIITPIPSRKPSSSGVLQ